MQMMQIMAVGMPVPLPCVGVRMGVFPIRGVFMCVAMVPVIVPVRVFMGYCLVGMPMPVFSRRCKIGAGAHKRQSNSIRYCGHFAENGIGNPGADEGGKGVEGTGAGGPQVPLGEDVEGNAQPIGYKAQK